MSLHWSWGLGTACILAVVIWLNSRHIRAGWLLGALVQLVNVGFGWLIYGQWTFAFLLIPAGMFVWVWWQHPRREAERYVTPTGLIAMPREISEQELKEFKARSRKTPSSYQRNVKDR